MAGRARRPLLVTFLGFGGGGGLYVVTIFLLAALCSLSHSLIFPDAHVDIWWSEDDSFTPSPPAAGQTNSRVLPEGATVRIGCHVINKTWCDDASNDASNDTCLHASIMNQPAEQIDGVSVHRHDNGAVLELTWRNVSADQDNGHGISVWCEISNHICTGQFSCRDEYIVHISRPPLEPRITGCVVDNWETLACDFEPTLQEQQKHTNFINPKSGGTRIIMRRRLKGSLLWEERNITAKQQHSVTWPALQYNNDATYDFQMLAQHKYATARSHIYQEEMRNIVKPRPVTELSVVEVAATAGRLEWTPPAQSVLLLMELCWTSTWETQCKNNVSKSWRLGELDPDTDYNVTVRVRPVVGEGYWSDPTHTTFHTLTQEPGENPAVRASSYESVLIDDDTIVTTVHWKPIPVREAHGPGLHYRVQYQIHGSSAHGAEQTQQDVYSQHWFILPGLSEGERLEASVWSVNDVGVCPQRPTHFRLSYDEEAKQHKADDLNFRVFADNGSLIHAKWEEPEESDWQPVFYWCKGSVLQGKCLSNFSWFDSPSPPPPAAADKQSVSGGRLLPVPAGVLYEDMLLGVAMEGASAAAGIQWAQCLYRYHTAPNPPMKVLFAEDQAVNSLSLSWTEAKCTHRPAGYADAIMLLYYPKGSHTERRVLNTTERNIVLTGLTAGQAYVLTLHTVSYSPDAAAAGGATAALYTSSPYKLESPVVIGTVFTGGVVAVVFFLSVLAVLLFVVGIWAVCVKGRARCKRWLFGIQMYPPQDMIGRSSESSEKHLMANGRGNIYTAQLSVRSGDSGYSDDILANAMAARHNATTVSTDTTLDDNVFDEPFESPPKHKPIRHFGDMVKSLLGSNNSLKSNKPQDEGFHSNATSAVLSDYSQLAGCNTPESVSYKVPRRPSMSAATSGVGSGSLPPYMLAAMLPVYQNVTPASSSTGATEKPAQPLPYVVQSNTGPYVILPMQGQRSQQGNPQAADVPYVLLPAHVPQGHVPQAHVPQAHVPQAHVPQGQRSSMPAGQQVGQGQFMPYVMLPTQGQGQSTPYVLMPQLEVKPWSSRAFCPDDPVQSSSMEELNEEHHPIHCDISPIVSTSSDSPFVAVMRNSQAGSGGTGAAAGAGAYVQLPDVLGQRESDSLLTERDRDAAARHTAAAAQGYVTHENVAAALGVGQPPMFLQPAAAFCNLPSVIAARQTVRPLQCRACRAPKLPRIEEVNSGSQSLSSSASGSHHLNSQSAAIVGMSSGQSDEFDWSPDLNSATAAPVGQETDQSEGSAVSCDFNDQSDRKDLSDDALIKFDDSLEQSDCKGTDGNTETASSAPASAGEQNTAQNPLQYFAIPVPNFVSPIDWSSLGYPMSDPTTTMTQDTGDSSSSRMAAGPAPPTTLQPPAQQLYFHIPPPTALQGDSEASESKPQAGYVLLPVSQPGGGGGGDVQVVSSSQPRTQHSTDGQAAAAASAAAAAAYVAVPLVKPSAAAATASHDVLQQCSGQPAASLPPPYVTLPAAADSSDNNRDRVQFPQDEENSVRKNRVENAANGYVAVPVAPPHCLSQPLMYFPIPVPAGFEALEMDSGGSSDEYIGIGARPKRPEKKKGEKVAAKDSQPQQNSGYVLFPVNGNLPQTNGILPQSNGIFQNDLNGNSGKASECCGKESYDPLFNMVDIRGSPESIV